MKEVKLTVQWLPHFIARIWRNRYDKGVITGGPRHGIYSIWKNHSTGEIRLYTAEDLNRATLTVNEIPAGHLRSAGRFGRLYLSS